MARATGRERVSNDGSKPPPPTRRGVGAKEPRPTAWGGARRELAAQTTAPSTRRAETSAPWAVAGSPRDEAFPWRAPRDENESATTVRSRRRQHGAVSVQRSLGQRRGVERAASWPRRQPRQARGAQRQVLCGRSLVLHVTKPSRGARHGTRTSQQRRFEAAAANTARCRCRGASANGVGWSAPRVGHADNRAKHAARRDKCSVGGRLVLHVTKPSRGARHGTRTSQQRRFEAAAANTARCRCKGASANGVGWSAPRVGHADNRAKHAARRDKCSVGGRWFST